MVNFRLELKNLLKIFLNSVAKWFSIKKYPELTKKIIKIILETTITTKAPITTNKIKTTRVPLGILKKLGTRKPIKITTEAIEFPEPPIPVEIITEGEKRPGDLFVVVIDRKNTKIPTIETTTENLITQRIISCRDNGPYCKWWRIHNLCNLAKVIDMCHLTCLSECQI